jgi:hypothetical protein
MPAQTVLALPSLQLQAVQKAQLSHPPSPGAPRRAVPRVRPQAKETPQAYPLGYVEEVSKTRTKLTGFINSLLSRR